MRKIILSIGTVRDAASIDVDDSILKQAMAESRWRPGIAMIGERKVNASRAKVIDGYQYKIGDQVLGNPPDVFLPTEFMDWRDG